ncbi:MAG: FHA domain-containing protein [Clostridiales bacterium]|nr:FHA domain-containing protein [Clostridiales bacterium]
MQSASFGETTVLSDESAGETTVLSNTSYSQSLTPHLIREKTKQVVFVDKSVLRIGAEQSYADFYLGDNPAISRSHADIVMRDGEFYIVDNNSTNQTFVDGRVIQPGIEVKIDHGTIFTLADEKFEFKLY